VPQTEPGGQRVNLRNLGTGDVTVQVLAITESGKKMTLPVTVPSEDLTSLLIPTAEKITSVEVDPEKLIIQTNYDNDSRPPKPDPLTLFNEGVAAFNKGEHARAEQKFREAVGQSPNNPLLRAYLARSLLAAGKLREAAAEAQTAMSILPPLASAIAWARIVLAEVAMAESRLEEAISHLRRAAVEAQDAPAQFASREALIRAERQAGWLPAADESIRSFMTQLDLLIKQPSSEKLYAAVYKNNLKRFVQGLTVSPPSSWATEILRAEPIDADRAAVDVAIKARAEGRDQSGTAVFLLHRYGSRWMLEDIRLFNVK
jgi:tetratricopeptide (TPR) repeat protein